MIYAHARPFVYPHALLLMPGEAPIVLTVEPPALDSLAEARFHPGTTGPFAQCGQDCGAAFDSPANSLQQSGRGFYMEGRQAKFRVDSSF